MELREVWISTVRERRVRMTVQRTLHLYTIPSRRVCVFDVYTPDDDDL